MRYVTHLREECVEVCARLEARTKKAVLLRETRGDEEEFFEEYWVPLSQVKDQRSLRSKVGDSDLWLLSEWFYRTIST